MKCVNANSLFLGIDGTLTDIDAIIAKGADTRTQSFMAKYLTVYIAGVYEQSVEEILNEYASLTGQLEIENFVANQLDKSFRNPDMANIIRVVKQFSTSWAEDLRLLPQKNKDAIDSIVNNKNLIAHGQPSVITVGDVKTYHADSTVVIEKIDDLFLGV